MWLRWYASLSFYNQLKSAVINHEAESWITDRSSADRKDESKGTFVKQAELVNVE